MASRAEGQPRDAEHSTGLRAVVHRGSPAARKTPDAVKPCDLWHVGVLSRWSGQNREFPMADPHPRSWQDAYEAAVLETNQALVPDRINEAVKAIQARSDAPGQIEDTETQGASRRADGTSRADRRANKRLKLNPHTCRGRVGAGAPTRGVGQKCEKAGLG
jgi:hypothetical protein